MAIPNGLTPSLPSGAAGWLSKAKIGDTVYAIKDAELRAILDTAAQKEAVNSIVKTGEGANYDNSHVPTTKAILDYLESAIQGLTGAMHFAGATTLQEGEDYPDALARLVASPEAGDVALVGAKEFVYDGSAWKELGDEGLYATKAELADAISNIEIAGVTMGNDHEITAQELKTALSLGSFAYVNSGTGTISTIDSGSVDFAGGNYTVSGTAVSVPQTFSAMDVTPAGSVSATASSVDIEYDKFGGASVAIPDMTNAQYQDVSSVVITSGSEGTVNYTPAGSVSVSANDAATFTAATTSVATVTDNGTAYTITAGSVSQGADTTSAFAYEGVTAAMDTTDTEMLVFSAAGTSNAVTAAGSITYTAPVLSGALPTFGNATVATGGTISLPSFSGSFTGTGAVLSATANKANANITGVGTTTAALSNLSYNSITVTVPAQSITASFTGTSNSVTPQVATSASAAPSDASISIAAATLTVDFTSSNKTITVSPAGA